MANFANILEYLEARNRQEPGIPIINEAARLVPELALFPFKSTRGVSHEYTRITKLPKGGFRAINKGIKSEAEDGYAVIEMAKRFEMLLEVDKAFTAGAAEGPAKVLADRARFGGQGMIQNIFSQAYYGTKNDPSGFKGLTEIIDPSLVFNAADGKTAPTAYSSAYIMLLNPEFGVGLFGPDNEHEQPMGVGPMREDMLVDEDGRRYPGYSATAGGWLGVAVRHSKCAARIKNISKETPLTAELLDDMLEDMPEMPTQQMAIFMNRRSYNIFRRSMSRKVKIDIGGEEIGIETDLNGPAITDYDGIKIVRSDSIARDEAGLEP